MKAATRRTSRKPFVLDPNALSPASEYARYIDGDVLGKIIARNLLINTLGYEPHQIEIPIGRFGDAATKYRGGQVSHGPGDGYIQEGKRRLSFEIKCARISIANRATGGTAQNWAHGGMLTTPAGTHKTYDLLIAIGVEQLGLEDDHYWQHLHELSARRRTEGIAFNIDALPHEPEFLAACSFLLMARRQIASNFFRVNVATVGSDRHAPFQAWGHDRPRCRARWATALSSLDA